MYRPGLPCLRTNDGNTAACRPLNLTQIGLGVFPMALLLCFAPPSFAERPPNILIILADDMGYSDAGCYGSEIQTPNLDLLASEGLRFTQFYNTARCWPTRAALMTGYYPQQVRRDTVPGIPSGGRGKRPAWAPLLPSLLKEAGYRSYHTGKWHIDGMPVESGFDQSYYVQDQGRFFNPKRHYLNDKPLPPVEKGTDYYATTALADHVVHTLSDHAENHSDKPFFQYLAFAAPHFPLHALPGDIEIYEDRYKTGWDAVRQQRWRRMQQQGIINTKAVERPSRVERNLGPPYHFPNAFEVLGAGETNRPAPWNSLTIEQKRFQAAKMSIHAAMIHRMDIEIGRVFQQIKDMGQWNDTLIIFLSDNGASAEIMVRDDGHDPQAAAGSAATYLCLGPGWSTVSNTPFRRHKTWTHEGGISTPLLVSWPRRIKAIGEIRTTPGHVVDVVPTILEVAGVSPKPTESQPSLPGKSLTSLFDADHRNPHPPIWWFHDGHAAIRDGDWKAVAPLGEPWELYNVATDRQESRDLAVVQGDRLKKLTDQWQSMFAQFVQDAVQDLPPGQQAKAKPVRAVKGRNNAQNLALPERSQVLLNGKSFLLNGRRTFTMTPEQTARNTDKPWIFYGPTLPAYPDKAESWMHERFLKAGIAVAGIDVGEAYGSPKAFPHFEALYQHMVAQGYSKTPLLLGRSRGGLWVSSWALKHPDRVRAIAGIYPVYDYTTYPGVKRAASAYAISPEELTAQQASLNPVKRAHVLAKARIPVFIIHGTNDNVVPLAANTGALRDAYRSAAAGELIEVIEAEGQGHSFWPGYFHCQELVDFVIERCTRPDSRRP